MIQDAGVFLGNDINSSGDSMEMVLPVYKAITEKYRCRSEWQKSLSIKRFKAVAAKMIAELPTDHAWGFKLPESLLVLPELASAFPAAIYAHQVRDPLTTCLRRTHMTARLDNHIGRIALAEAYDHLEILRTQILQDSPAVHMAITTTHQLGLVEQFRRNIHSGRFHQIRFEDVLLDPDVEFFKLCNWLKVTRSTHKLHTEIDLNRAYSPKVTYDRSVVESVTRILGKVRSNLGYS
jgi:hypothetical protein